jgi:ubiquinone/menaquinone biosynthesis C-methylase UbiE
MDKPLTALATDFEREAFRIDQQIWDILALHEGESVLFCNFGKADAWIMRAIEIGCVVSVIDSDEEALRTHANIGATVVRGSTSVIPARDNTFDAAVAFHYLHEIDPLFHANVISELSRVAKRVSIVEPAPPTDPIGSRIAGLYSRAKREFGAFEYYQPLEYWKKLLSIVKGDVSAVTIAFTRVPSQEAAKDTVDLLIETMAVEEAPESDIAELRALAKMKGAQIMPQARFVLVGAAVGEIPAPSAGTAFRERPPEPEPPKIPVPVRPAIPSRPKTYAMPDEAEVPPLLPPPPAPGGPAKFVPPQATPTIKPAAAAAAPGPADAPAAAPPIPEPVAKPAPAKPDKKRPQPFRPRQVNPAAAAAEEAAFGLGAFGAPPPPDDSFSPPFGVPFAVSAEETNPADVPFGHPPAAPGAPAAEPGLGWSWEPPDDPI